jgi:hypothetical protein
MSESAEFGDTIVTQWYANLPKHGVPQGSIVSFLCVDMDMSKRLGVN